MNERVVVTGLGAVTGLGGTWQELWEGLLAGRCAVRAWSPPGVTDFPVGFGAPVDDSALPAPTDQPADRRTRLGLAAAGQALAGLGRRASVLRSTATAIGSGTPERDPLELLPATGDGDPSWINLYARRGELRHDTGLFQPSDALATRIARRHRLGGPVLNLTTACAGAAHAVGHGFRMIRRGEADAVLAGGADAALNLQSVLGLTLLGATSVTRRFGPRLCRPFDRERSGIVIGEGAGMLLLESERSALRRGAFVHAEIAGFGTSLDAHQVTAPHPEGAGAVLAMRRALADAGLAPGEVDCVNAHGTSTPLNDRVETAALKKVFADDEHYRRLAVTANKSALGHLVAAAGGPELVATVLTVRDGVVPPTLHLDSPDPACDLDYVPHEARSGPFGTAISNSFGFGGINATLVVRKYERR